MSVIPKGHNPLSFGGQQDGDEAGSLVNPKLKSKCSNKNVDTHTRFAASANFETRVWRRVAVWPCARVARRDGSLTASLPSFDVHLRNYMPRVDLLGHVDER